MEVFNFIESIIKEAKHMLMETGQGAHLIMMQLVGSLIWFTFMMAIDAYLWQSPPNILPILEVGK